MHPLLAPEKPKNLSLEVLTPAYMDLSVRYVNVSLYWDPPDHTHEGNDVLRYVLAYRKEPPYGAAQEISKHRDVLNISSVRYFLLS